MKKDEWNRYYRQAEHTLASARRDADDGDHDWACFKAQQAAELAIKGYIRATREFVTGHSVTRLLTAMEGEVPETIVDCARRLDMVYIPTRYPDAYDAGSPMDYYTAVDSQQAINCARITLEWLHAKANA